jgi:diamine N-acetyltransferase
MITIRKANVRDCDVILQWENDPLLWEVTDDKGPFTQNDITEFLIEKNSLDKVNQERWIIEDVSTPIGMIDLFEWNRKEKSIGIGIAIPEIKFRKKGYASHALKILHTLLFEKYDIQLFHCLIHPNNEGSIQLFRKLGYQKTEESIHRHQQVHRYKKKIQS